MPFWPTEFETIIRSQCRSLEAGQAVAPDDSLALLGVDSLGMVAIIIEIESRFGIVLPDEILAGDDLNTPATIWKVVERLAGKAEPDPA
jgi:acyl carrier protein